MREGEWASRPISSYLAQHGVLRRFVPLEKPSHQGVDLLGPSVVADQDDLAVAFDDGGDHGSGIVPEHVAAILAGTGETLASPQLLGTELGATLRAEPGRSHTMVYQKIGSYCHARPWRGASGGHG